MKGLTLISAVLMLLTWCYALPGVQSVGAYAYSDSAGNRYGGVIGPDGIITPDSDPLPVAFDDVNTIYPDYFGNFDNIVQAIFDSIENQRLASYAARKAYDVTYNRAGYVPNFFRFPPFGGIPFFGAGPGFVRMGDAQNSAYAGAMAGPGFSHQIAAINPANQRNPNVDVTNRFSDTTNPNNKFYSVSSSSYASSSDVNGKTSGTRGAETVVNNNGKVTAYKVQS